ncbi:MAG: hypothetical protein CMC19_10150 [Flavobacteriaceae bacterium]|nr:hypothetical protein [Flavobacteriaceae bacterium]
MAFVSFNSYAQQYKKQLAEKMNPEQRIELRIKQLTLALDLSEPQAKKVRKALEEFKPEKKDKQDRSYERKVENLDRQIAFQRTMKNILSDDQFELFRKLKAQQGKRKRMAYSRIKRGRKVAM